VNVVVTVSNATPLVDSSVTVTATVTNNGQPVPNGTAVEFSTSAGTLDGGGTAILKTTNGGVATVTLTSGSPGLVRVTVVVNNITRTTDVNFSSRPVTPPPPNTTPSITSVSPTVGRPQGGDVLRITGTNFNAPVRVLFNTGGATAIEASVQAVTATSIDVVTPPVNLGAGQQLIADIIVLTLAGSAGEQRVEASDAFTFRNVVLTPRISTISPNSGPVTGGTRVTIFGDGFQEPVQVLFNTAEARVLNVEFDRINIETPAGRDTNPDGTGPLVGPVAVLVRNINSQTQATMAAGFHYKAGIQITAVSPLEGPAAGGTRVTIDGNGFVSPLVVLIGGVEAQQISVTGTQLVVLTSNVYLTDCADISGPVEVTNVVNGDSAEGPTFIFRVPQPTIIAVSPSIVPPGGSITVTVANAQPGINRFELRGLEADDNEDADIKTVFPTGVTFNPDGSATFTITIPTNFRFERGSCFVAGQSGERLLDLSVDVTYLNIQSGCTDTAEDVFEVDVDNGCVPLPSPELTQTAPVPPSCAIVPATPVGSSNTTSITFSNSGNAALIITPNAPTGPNASEFVLTPPTQTIPPSASGSFTVTFAPAGVGIRTANVTFVTNDSDEQNVTVCMQGTGTP
jgi:hypothetical protein